MTYEQFDTLRIDIPEQPGVYRYYDKDGDLLYVGKAKNLKKRVSSYFTNHKLESARTKLLVIKIYKIEFTVVYTEQDALLLENSLIKEHQPKYNVMLKDDKTYPFVCIKNEPFPRVFLTRNLVRDGSEYFGPYTAVSRVKLILETFTKAFPMRTCNLNLSQKNIDANKFKVCLEYHIGNCLGPCVGKQSEAEYVQSMTNIRQILKGNISWVIEELNKKMIGLAENFEFEAANDIKEKLLYLGSYMQKSTIVSTKLTNLDVFALAERDGLCFINYFKIFNGTITSTRTYEVKRKLEESNEEVLLAAIDEVRIQNGEEYEELVLSIPVTYENEKVKITLPQVGEKKKLVDLSMKNALYALRQRLTSLVKLKHETPANRILAQMQVDLRLTELPVHIECFDNSNIQGTNPVSACVVFKNARAAKKEYRHFKVQTVVGPDDFATMEEAVFRRYSKFVEEHLPMPQLIIIDGGKGQLSAAMTSLTKLGLKGKVAVIGIAKRLEEIYFPHDSLPLYIDKKSETLKLIQQLRDEAHRFGITFHRELRSKAALVSTLDNIKGIGPESIKILLKEYKLISNMKLASHDDLALKLGNAKAAIVKKYFEEND